MVYEVCTFQALREQLRCKEIWVVGADRWRNPAEDLPTDFEERRVEHYAALRKPLDPTEFVDELRAEMRAELDALHAALPRYDWLTISDRASGAITLTPLAAAPEPRNLRRLKQAVHTRWGVVPLIDMLKEAVLRTGCLRGVTSVADRGNLPEDVLAERLLLAICAYGTNTGIRAVASGARPRRGRYPLRAAPLPERRVGAADRDRHRQCHLRCATNEFVGHRLHRRRLGLHAFRIVRSEHLHRVAFPLRWSRRTDLLARREGLGGDPLAAAELLGLGGPRHGRRRDPPRHRHGRGSQLR